MEETVDTVLLQVLVGSSFMRWWWVDRSAIKTTLAT